MGADEDEYGRAERAYLDAVKNGAASEQLLLAARHVCETAREWESSAYEQFFARRSAEGAAARVVFEMEIEAEKAELLHELWNDIAAAHGAITG